MSMRLLGSVLLTAMVSFGVVVTGGSGPALACSCAYQRMPQYVGAADDVFTGSLVGMVDPPRKLFRSSSDPITYTVAVDAVYRGDVGSVAVFESAMSDASCGLSGMVVDRRYLVLTDVHGARRTASSCGGTAEATPRRLRAAERLLGEPTPPAIVVDGVDAATAVPAAGTVPAGIPRWALGGGAVLGAAVVLVGLRRRRRST